MASPKRNANRRKFNRQPIDVDDLTSASSFSGIRETIESHFGKPDTQEAATEGEGGEGMRSVEADPARPQYVWEPKGVPFSVRIDAELIERLEKQSLDIFRAITNRGSEIGGILLGHVLPGWPLSILVEDYEAVECAYTLGPTYRLSDDEKARLEEAIDRRKEESESDLVPVGFFRSNTRPTLVLQDDDLELFDDSFPEDHNVFLLAKPYSRKPCQGAIFVREGGKVRTDASPQEFAFSRVELEKAGELQPGIKLSAKPERVGPASTSDRVTPINGAPEARRPEAIVPVAAPAPTPIVPPPAETRPTPALRIERPLAEDRSAGRPVEPRIEPRVEPAPPRIEPRVEPRIEPRVEIKPEPRVEPKVEPRVSSVLQPRVEPKVEPRVGSVLQPRVEPRIEQKTEPRVEPKVEARKPWERPSGPLTVSRVPVAPPRSAEPSAPPVIERPLFTPTPRVEPPPAEAKSAPAAPPRLTTRIQPRVPPSVQPRIEANLGSKPAPASAPPGTPRFMTRLEPKAPAPSPPPVEEKAAPVVEPRIAPRVEPVAPPPPVQAKAEPEVKVEPKPEPRIEPAGPRFTKIRPRMQVPAPKAQPKPEPKPELKPEPKPEPKAEVTSAPDFGYKEDKESQGKRRWLLPVVIALVIGGAGSYIVLRPSKSAPDEAPAAASAQARPQVTVLTLQTSGSDEGLTVFWDGNAAPISTAPGGRLSVRDGAATKNFDLTAEDLKKGTYPYKPRTDDVTFRLELTDLPRGRSASGVIHVLGAKRMGKR